jgi:hypothetical protein
VNGWVSMVLDNGELSILFFGEIIIEKTSVIFG